MPKTQDEFEVLTGAAAVAEADANLNAGGFHAPPRDYARLVEAAKLWRDYTQGSLRESRRALLKIQETITTTDLPYLLGGVIDRELLTAYQAAPQIWSQFATRTTVRDFRTKNLVDLLGGRSILQPVGQHAEYPRDSVSDAEYPLTVAKRGKITSITWEDIVNDDLDALRRLPDNHAQSARDTEDYLATSQLVNASGANTAFFKTANGNAPTALALDATNLATAVTAVTSRKDSDDKPIVAPKLKLMVPPGLQIPALAILNAIEIDTVDSGTKTVKSTNYLRSLVELVVNPWLTVISTDAKAATRWFLLPDPGTARPGVALGFLRGHEQPDLRVKADTGNRVGGGSIDPTEGSFDMDDIEYRVRHVVGGATVDPVGTYCSNGS